MPATIETYTVPSIYAESSYFSVKAENTEIPVISFLTDRDYDYAHFSFSGSTTITITVCEPIDTYSISPLAFEIQGTVVGNTLTFDLQESGRGIGPVPRCFSKILRYAIKADSHPCCVEQILS